MRMNLENPRDQQGTLRRGHASHIQWVDVLEVDLDAVDRPAELELEDLQRAPPRISVALAKVMLQ